LVAKIYLNLSNSPKAFNPESGLKAGNFSPIHLLNMYMMMMMMMTTMMTMMVCMMMMMV
jgi:hypothetical protein